MKTKHQFTRLQKISILLIFFFSCGIFAQETYENSISFSKSDSNLKWSPCPDFMPEGCYIAVLHGNPAEKNTDIFFKVPANSFIPAHTHTSAERMVVISGELEVTYEGEQPQTLKEGTYAYGPAGKPHSAKCGDSPCVLFIAFEEPMDAMPIKKD